MPEYQSPGDLTLAQDLAKLAPQEAQAFIGLKSTAERSDGVIPAKYRDLMSVWAYNARRLLHRRSPKNAAEAGATREEIAEVVFIAAALRAAQPWETVYSHCAWLIKPPAAR